MIALAKTNFHKTLAYIFIIGSFLIFSCQNTKRNNLSNFKIQNNYCTPTVKYNYEPEILPFSNIDSILKHDTLLQKKISTHDLLMANATGTLALLKKLLELKSDSTLYGKIQYLATSTKIESRLLLASTEISSMSAEIDCEGERADQLAGYLDDLNNKRNRKLTTASIIIGSITIAITSTSRNNNMQRIAGISGGMVSGVLAGLTAFPSMKKIRFEHERNLLEDIWFESKNPSIYPPFTWYILKEKRFSNSKEYSIIHNIKSRWLSYELGDKKNDVAQKLLFQKGGLYSAINLHKRADMLNQLQSAIRSINQDLQSYISILHFLKE